MNYKFYSVVYKTEDEAVNDIKTCFNKNKNVQVVTINSGKLNKMLSQENINFDAVSDVNSVVIPTRETNKDVCLVISEEDYLKENNKTMIDKSLPNIISMLRG